MSKKISIRIQKYVTLTEAAISINVSRTAISKVLNIDKTIKKQYIIYTKTKSKNIFFFVKWIVIHYLGRRTSAQPLRQKR